MLDELLLSVVAHGGSDLHLAAGVPPKARIHGELRDLLGVPLNEAQVKDCLKECLSEDQVRSLVKSHDVDGIYTCPQGGRFRVHAFRQMGSYSLVFRHIAARISTIDQLGLPPVLKTLAQVPRGLIMVTGTSGSGKTTTLAALIDQINSTACRNIITIEDPVEYVHESRRSIIRHRNLGSDVASFASGLRAAMREDPDVILIGEMRDFETINAAIMAADTGHLVFATLHTTNCLQTVERILTFYPTDQQEQIRLSLSINLVGVIAQRLIPRKDQRGRITALEIMTSTPLIRKLVREGDLSRIAQLIEDGGTEGMQSFNQVIYGLFRSGAIYLEDALEAASNPDELRLRLKVDGLI